MADQKQEDLKKQEEAKKKQEEAKKQQEDLEKRNREKEEAKRKEEEDNRPKGGQNKDVDMATKSEQGYAAKSASPGAAENIRRTEEKDDEYIARRPKPRPYKVNMQADAIQVEARGAYDNLVGELFPGESGWLPLDAVGQPAGPSVREFPDPATTRACRVMANGAGQPGDVLVTNTGAPITPVMQANSDVLPFTAPPEIPVARTSQNHRDREEDRQRVKEREEGRDRARESAQQSGMSR